jgi:hypothetical protein
MQLIVGRNAAIYQQRIPVYRRAFEDAWLCRLVWEATHLAESVYRAGEAFDEWELSQSTIYGRVWS